MSIWTSVVTVIVVSLAFFKVEAGNNYSALYEQYQHLQVHSVQRTWRPIKATNFFWGLVNSVGVKHAGLLLSVVPGTDGSTQVPTTLVVHLVPVHFTVVEPTDLAVWKAYENPVLIHGTRFVRDFVSAGGQRYHPALNSCVDAARRMMCVADRNEEFVIGLKRLKKTACDFSSAKNIPINDESFSASDETQNAE